MPRADSCPDCGYVSDDCTCRPQWMARSPTPLRQPLAFGSLIRAAGNSSSGQPPVRGRAWAGGLALLLMLLVGCAALRPGADPIIVRAEQLQTVAGVALDLVVEIDHTDRGFWRTNAPAFHVFVETLRQPVFVPGLPEGRQTLPRYIAVQWQLDQSKLAYKAAKSATGSNVVETALAALNALTVQASGWLSVVTNRPAN